MIAAAVKIKLTVKQRATLTHIRDWHGLHWISSRDLGRLIYGDDEDNYRHTVERTDHWTAFSKIGTDRVRALLGAGLVDRRWSELERQFTYRLTSLGEEALRGS